MKRKGNYETANSVHTNTETHTEDVRGVPSRGSEAAHQRGALGQDQQKEGGERILRKIQIRKKKCQKPTSSMGLHYQ